jgi:hypothetical protein
MPQKNSKRTQNCAQKAQKFSYKRLSNKLVYGLFPAKMRERKAEQLSKQKQTQKRSFSSFFAQLFSSLNFSFDGICP